MPDERATSRRKFLRNCVAGALGMGTVASLRSLSGDSVTQTPHARVCIARDPRLRGGALQTNNPLPTGAGLNEQRTLELLDGVLHGLFPSAEPSRVWAGIVRPGEMVAIKVNTLGGRGLSSSVQVVHAVCERLQAAGVRAENIVIFDRDTGELERAGFHIRSGGAGVQCFGSDRTGYEDELSAYGLVGSRISRILTRRCDALINVPVLKDHDGAGISVALKNMYGVIHNPNKYHPNGCNPYIADVNMLPEIRSRLRLTICDATSACYEGGPAFKPEYVWQPNALIAARDSVALDTVAWQMIERKRAEKGVKTLEADERAPHYIATAADAEHRLGINDLRRITIEELQVS